MQRGEPVGWFVALFGFQLSGSIDCVGNFSATLTARYALLPGVADFPIDPAGLHQRSIRRIGTNLAGPVRLYRHSVTLNHSDGDPIGWDQSRGATSRNVAKSVPREVLHR